METSAAPQPTKHVARRKKQGFQTHAPASADAGETKPLLVQGFIEVKIKSSVMIRVHRLNAPRAQRIFWPLKELEQDVP